MASPYLILENPPRLKNATLLLALTGWMDGGDVSTGTVKQLMDNRQLTEIAHLDADSFYIFNFPGPMEVAAVFRPEVTIRKGLVRRSPKFPENMFHADAPANLVFFLGAEPHLRWQAFADAIFELCHATGVTRIVFVGSFGGTVPHTREPRMFGSVSHAHLADTLKAAEFEVVGLGGAVVIFHVAAFAGVGRGIEMLSFVAEIPGYLNGENPLSIEAVTRRLGKFLNQPINFDSLREASNTWEQQVSEAVEKDTDLAETVRKLEEAYDNELIGKAQEKTEGEGEAEGQEEE